MTSLPAFSPSEPPARGAHPGELRLRRFRAGELDRDESESLTRHTAECGRCRSGLRALEDEQTQFEQEIPFPRFAGGVERAQRVPRARPRRLWAFATVAFAAAAALLLVVRTSPPGAGNNRLKGADDAEGVVRIAAPDGGGQRSAEQGVVTVLLPGELMRIGYRTSAAGYLAAVSVDDAGKISRLYPADGKSLAVTGQAGTVFLPDSLQLTGAGRERLFLIIADRPLGDDVAVAVGDAWRTGHGDLVTMPLPQLLGPVHARLSTWLFQKP